MTTHTSHAPGTFCWPELYSTDPSGAVAFYAALFGWQLHSTPMGPDNAYTIFRRNGADAAACCGKVPEMVAAGTRSHWMPYLSVASTDETTLRARAAGGAVLKEPFDVPHIGRMAALRDPVGAAFCVWQAKGHIGVGVTAEPGCYVWNELLSRDPGPHEAFYRNVFDWETRRMPLPDGSIYYLFVSGPAPSGGMLPITPEMGPIASCWCVYFQVESTDAAVGRTLELGGSISVPAQDVAGVGRFAVLIDPSDAHFGILQPAPPG